MSALAEQLHKMGVVETLKETQDGGVSELLGRVPREKSDLWGVMMRNALLAAARRHALDSLDLSRYYYLSRQTIHSETGNKKKQQQVDMILTWNWRIRFDERGEQFLLAECSRVLDTEFRRQAITSGSIPIAPVQVPGAHVVEVGMGDREPDKVNRV